jgi:hypothetical protein
MRIDRVVNARARIRSRDAIPKSLGLPIVTLRRVDNGTGRRFYSLERNLSGKLSKIAYEILKRTLLSYHSFAQGRKQNIPVGVARV